MVVITLGELAEKIGKVMLDEFEKQGLLYEDMGTGEDDDWSDIEIGGALDLQPVLKAIVLLIEAEGEGGDDDA